MNKFKILLFLNFLYIISFGQQINRPKLIVGIIIDQMRDEYIDRFYNDFGNDGFRRIVNEGYRMKNFHYNYMPTYTAPGHSSVYTGTTPRYHGIVANEFYLRKDHKEVYCTFDERFRMLGLGDTLEGKMSPFRLKSTTMTDELKLSTNFRAKVIGISVKDRAAILPAGHLADWAFWLSNNGNFISSSFYGDKLPEWVEEFNNKKYYEKYLNEGWKLLKDQKEYDESLSDKNPYEGKLNNRIEAVFPYNFVEEYKKFGASVLKMTPGGNSILIDLAKTAIENEKMGEDNVPDFLAISFSAPDYVGHVLGPRSMETEDMYLRLDLLLGDFLKYLDQKIGKGNYLLFLTADHACGENPNFLHDHKFEVRNIIFTEVRKKLDSISVKLYNTNLIEAYGNQNIHFNLKRIDSLGLDRDEVFRNFQSRLEEINYIRRAYLQSELMSCSPDFLEDMIAQGYDQKQNGDMVLLFDPAYMEYNYYGTTHGTPYGYDTHVPGLFYGWKIPHGINYDKHFITEIAPSISELLHITLPSASKDITIHELFGK